jgi:hypothetical protein
VGHLKVGRLAVAAACACLGLCAYSGAAAADEAHFSVTLSGHYATNGTVTDSQCEREDANGTVTTFTATGSASESTRFRSVRPGSLTFAQFPGGPINSGGVVTLIATMTRTGDLDGEGPPNCTAGPAVHSGCGTVIKHYKAGFGTSVTRPPFESYHLVGPAVDQTPRDPFPECKLVFFDDPWVSIDPGRTRLPSGKIFDPGVRRIVLRGSVNKIFDKRDGEDSMHVAEHLHWTLTLRRR